MAKEVARKVVYLWGAGATHAEAQSLGSRISLLVRDTPTFGEGITNRILRRAGRRVVSAYGGGEGVDIEKLITLLGSSGTHAHADLAEELRESYFLELKTSLATAKVNEPQLAISMLRLHSDLRFRNVEELSGIITTNHDGLLQVASHQVYGKVNVGFDFASREFSPTTSFNAPTILQLHGSFTWKFGMPISIERLNHRSLYENTVWIPPTTVKESKNYPFNKLVGLAYELLARNCDVLRIVGTSLTQNDWNILSLIFNAQRHREATKGQAFLIELIMPHKHGESLKRDCAYLKNLQSIGYLTDGKFSDYDVTPVSHPAGTGIRSSSNAPDGRPSSSSFCVHRAA